MGTAEIFKKVKTTRVGIFSLGDVYREAHGWLEDKGYDIVENVYDERTYANGKQFLMKWTATREIDKYSQFKLEVDFFLRKIKDVEVKQGADKAKLQNGEFNLTVTATLVTDYDERWEERPFFKFMQGFYEKYVYKDTIGRLKGQLWDDGWAFINEVKALMNLYKYM